MAGHTLVVGGTRGIGRALARHLLSEGQRVGVLGRKHSTAGQLEHPNLTYHLGDLRDEVQREALLGAALGGDEPVTGLALLQRYRPWPGDDPAGAWGAELETSLTLSKLLVEEALVRSQALSSVVFVSSVAGRLVAEEQPLAYHVAKAGAEQMVRFLAVTLGSRGVRVNAVAPGSVLKEETRAFLEADPERMDMHRRAIPLGRMGTAEEVAGVIAFLLGDQSSFVTGQVLRVDGGSTLRFQESLAPALAPKG